MAMIDAGIYVGGTRVLSPDSLRSAYKSIDATGGTAWIGLLHPTAAELTSVAREFNLHPLAVEDARKGHQRAKLERYGDTLFVVLRPAWYVDEDEAVEFGEVHVSLDQVSSSASDKPTARTSPPSGDASKRDPTCSPSGPKLFSRRYSLMLTAGLVLVTMSMVNLVALRRSLHERAADSEEPAA